MPWNQPKHQKWFWYQFLMIKMPTGPSLSEIPSKSSDFNFSSLRPLIRGGHLLKSLSGLSEWFNLLYFFIQASGWSQIFRIYKEIENRTTLNKVMAPGNWCKKIFLIIFAQNAKNHFFMLISMKFDWQTMFLMFPNHFFDFAFVLGFVFYIFKKFS